MNLLLIYDLQSLALPEEGLIIGIYFGTGIGNAISWNGQLLVGKNGVAGELGHIPQLGSGDICGCGNVGCMEPIGGGRRLSQLCRSVFRNIDVAELYACYADTPEVLAQDAVDFLGVRSDAQTLYQGMDLSDHGDFGSGAETLAVP